MAKSKKSTAPQTQTQNTQTKENTTMSTIFTELDENEVVETQGQTRARGQYDAPLAEFVASGSRGVRITSDGAFAGKKPGAIKAGLEGAVKRMEKAEAGSGDGIKVVLFKSGTGDSATEEVRLLNSNAGQ